MIDTKALLQIYEQEIIDSFKSLGGKAIGFRAFYECVIEVIQRHDPCIMGLDRTIVHSMYQNLNSAT